MNPEERNKLVWDFLETVCLPLMKSKGATYAQVDLTNDANANFKRAAERWGVTVGQAIGVYMGKHFDALETYVRTGGQAESEPIALRLADLVNYALIFYSWLVESGAIEPPRSVMAIKSDYNLAA